MGVWFKIGFGLWVWGFACRDVISGLLVQQLKLSSLRVCGGSFHWDLKGSARVLVYTSYGLPIYTPKHYDPHLRDPQEGSLFPAIGTTRPTNLNTYLKNSFFPNTPIYLGANSLNRQGVPCRIWVKVWGEGCFLQRAVERKKFWQQAFWRQSEHQRLARSVLHPLPPHNPQCPIGRQPAR